MFLRWVGFDQTVFADQRYAFFLFDAISRVVINLWLGRNEFNSDFHRLARESVVFGGSHSIVVVSSKFNMTSELFFVVNLFQNKRGSPKLRIFQRVVNSVHFWLYFCRRFAAKKDTLAFVQLLYIAKNRSLRFSHPKD